MRALLFIVMAAVAGIGFAISRLRRPYVACGIALLGAVLAGFVAFVAGNTYVSLTSGPPRADADWGGAEKFLTYGIIYPGVSAFFGLVLGIGYAYRRESSKAEPLDM